MGVEVIYACDKCGHAQRFPDQMWEVLIGIKMKEPNKNILYGHQLTQRTEKLWCRKCVEQSGLFLIPEEKKEEATKNEAPNIENLIRDIVFDEVKSAMSSLL